MNLSDSESDPCNVVEVNDNDLPNDDEHSGDEAMEAGDESEVDERDEVLQMPERKVKKPSPEWKCADKVDEGARCKFCKRVFKTKDGNTKSIIRHVTEKHSSKPDVKLMKMEMTKKKEELNQKKKQKVARKSLQPKIFSFSKKRCFLDPMKKKKIEDGLVTITSYFQRGSCTTLSHCKVTQKPRATAVPSVENALNCGTFSGASINT